MSALARQVVEFDALRDKSYRLTRLGEDVTEFLAWKELGGVRPTTLDQYERDLARGCLMFPSKGIREISDGDMIHIARSFKSKERRTRVAAYKSFFKWAVQQRKIDRNPADALPTIKRQPKRVFDLFTEPEIAALCNLPIRDGALFQIMFDAGPRKGDCRVFQVQHYRPEATEEGAFGHLVFHEGKGGKDRTVPATQAVAQKLSDLVTLEGLKRGDHLWYAEKANAVSRRLMREKPIGDGSFDRWYYRCLDEAGVPYQKRKKNDPDPGRGNPHSTRHTFAMRWLRRGARLETLSMALGHESIKTTFDLYGHLDTSDMALDLALIEGKAK